MNRASPWRNRLLCGDSLRLLPLLPSDSIDLIVTDPPYLVNYRSRDGRAFPGDDPAQAAWLPGAFAELFRLLKPGGVCVSFYGFSAADQFVSAFRQSGFSIRDHLVWQKPYASSRGLVARTHESAYVLSKGRPSAPSKRIADVLPWGRYTGNRLHPCQKPVENFLPVIEAFSRPGDIVLDPFAGSASTAVAAHQLGRDFIAIEHEWQYFQAAHRRLFAGTRAAEISVA